MPRPRQGRAGIYRDRSKRVNILNKLKAYELQETGLETVQANLELWVFCRLS